MTAMLKKTLIRLSNASRLVCILALVASSAAYAVPSDLSLTGNLSSPTISVNNSSTLTYTLSNSSSSNSASAIGFTINLPTNIVIANQTNDSMSCGSGDYTLSAGGNSVIASGYQLGQGQNCQLVFNITASAAGVFNITSTDLSSSDDIGPDSSTTLTVSDTNVFAALSLSSSSISAGGSTELTLALFNPSDASVYGFSGQIILPEGLVISSTTNLTSDCGDYMTLTQSADARSITLFSQNTAIEFLAFLPSGSAGTPSSCSVIIDVLSSGAGNFNLTTSDMTYSGGSIKIGKAGASLSVQKQFVNMVLDPFTVTPGQTANLNVTLTNFDRSNTANNITFTDDLNAALTGLIATGLPLNNACGSGSVVSGTGSVSLTNGSLAGGESCSFTIPVTVPVGASIGSYTNTVSNISSSIGTYPSVTNSFRVSNAPTLTMSVVESSITAGDAITLRYTLTNIDGANAVSDLTVSTVIGATSVASITTLPGSNFCNGSGISAISSPTTDSFNVGLSAITLAASESCTFDVGLTLSEGLNSGSYYFTAQQIIATIGGNSVSSKSPSASASIIVDTAPNLRFSFQDNVMLPGASGFIDFELSHHLNASADATNIAFTLDLDAGLSGLVATGLPISNVCGIGSTISGTSTLSFSSGMLTPGESCSFSVPVQLPAGTVGSNFQFSSSDVGAVVAANAVVKSGGAASLIVSGLRFSQSFSDNAIRVGTGGTQVDVIYLLTNEAGAGDATGIGFTQSFSSFISGTTIASANQNAFCGAGSATSVTGGNLVVSGVDVANGDQCALTITLNIPSTVVANNYLSVSSNLSATIGGVNTSISPAVANLNVNELTVVTSIDVSSPTSESIVTLSINFSDDVTGFDETGINAVNASLTGFTGTGSSYTVEVTPTANGDVTLQIGADAAFDILDGTVGNKAAIDIVFEYQSTPIVATPSLTLSNPSSVLVNSGPVTYTVNYVDVEQVDLNSNEVTLNTTGTANADITVLNGDTSSVTVSLDNIVGNGSLGISLVAGTARYSTNLAPSAGPSSVFVVDTLKPSVVLSTASLNQTADFTVNIVFDENVSGFDINDISVVNGSLSNFQTIDAKTYSVVVSATGETAVGLSVVDSAASDSAGNGNNTSNSLNVTYDDLLPSVSISGPSGTVTVGFTATIDFSELVTGFDVNDIQVTNANLSAFTNVDGKQYTVAVSPIAQSTVSLAVDAAVAFDTLNNSNTASSGYSVVYDFNDAPVISGSPATSVNEDSVYSFTPSVSDNDSGDTLAFSISNKPTWASFNVATGLLSGTPTNADVGTTSGIVISVNDGSVTIALSGFSISVANTNDAPVISGSPATSVNEDSAYSFTPSVSDDDSGDSLSFSITNKPTWASFNVATGLLSGTPTNADVGTTSGIVISVNDGSVTIALSGFSISVANTNDAPVISGSPATSVNEDSAYSFTPSVSDDDSGDSLSFSITNKPTWASFNVATGLLSGTPTNADVGSTSAIVISVNDGTVTSSLSAFSISVANTNDAPVISGSPATSVNEDSVYSFTPSVSDDDSGDSLSFSITNKPTWASFNVATGLLSGTPTNADVGTTSGIVISVNDGSVTIALSGFSISVANTNDAPVISGSPATSVNEDSGYSFTPSVSDDDSGDSFTFSITNKPTWASFNSANGQLSGTPTNADVGTTSGIVISVNDGSVTIALSGFSISVANTNDAPVISGSPATSVNEDSAYSFTPSVSDDDSGDSLSFSITNKPTWASFNSANGQLSGTPTNADVGTTSGIVISVNDGTVTSSLSAFSISVANTNDAPVISGSPATSVNEDSVYSFTPSVSDDDSGDSLSFSITNKPTWASFNSANGQLSGTPTNADVGSTTAIVISVNDGSVTIALSGFSISVANTNDAPVISGSPATSVNEDSAYSFTPSVSDDDSGDSLSFSITNKPTWASFNSANGQLSGTPTNADVGSTSAIVISVNDGSVTIALTAFSISVANTNDAPVISGSPATSVNEDSVYSFTPSVSDDDSGDSLSFSITNKPTWASFNVATGLLSGTPTNADVGTTSGIVISVNDGTVTSSLSAFSISVANTNDAPVISGSPATSVNEDSVYSFTPSVTDDDSGDSLSFSITNKPTWASFNSANGQLSGTPTNADVGSTSAIVISVNDGTVTSSLTAFSISVVNTNDVPVISSAAIVTAMQDQVYQYTFVVLDDDSGDVLTFSAVVKPDWLNFNTATAVLSGTPTNADVGSHVVTLKVTDGAGLSAEQNFSISVNNVNDAPVISSIAVLSATQDQIYNYTLVATDADTGDSLSFNASVKPDWLSFDTVSGILSGTPTNSDVGSHSVTLTVTDNAGLHAEQSFSISVNNVNDAPVISSIAVLVATQDQIYNYTLVATDADTGDSLSFNASVKPDWLSFDTVSGILSGTPTNADVGSHSVTLTVTDNAGLHAEQSFSIDVSNVNDAPEIMGTPLLSINEDESYTFKPDVTDADEDDSLSFIIVNKPTWAKFSDTDGTLSGIPSNDDVGVTLSIVISVSDGTIEVELPAFDIEVINVNDAPVFESEPITEASVFAPYQYDVVVSDADVDASLTVAVVMAPEWLSLNSANQLVGTPPAESADMTFEVEVSVTDAIVDLPVIQRFSLAVSQPTDTELGVNIYFSPAPAIVGQKVNLVVDIVNNGYTAALGLNYQLTFGSEFLIVALPNECSEQSTGVIDCIVADELAIGDSLSRIIELMVDNVDSGFSSASISVTASNVNNEVFDRDASILLANTLSILPGKVLTSVPASLGYAVDMNADSFTDLLVYLPDELAIQIMINDGLGQLTPGAKVVLNQAVTSFTAADINVDGNIDIITTGGDIAGNRAYMLDGLFTVTSTENLDDVKADVMLIVDFDFDGYSEVVLAGVYQPQVAIYSGVGSGSPTVNLVPIPFSLPSFSAEKGPQQVSAVTDVITSSESKITALSAIATDGVIKLLVGVENQAPVLLTPDDNDWVSSAVVSLTQGVQRLINTDLDNDGKADLFVKDDNGWHLIMDAFSNDFIKSSVMFPNADDIVVTDLEADGIPELLLVMSHGVSIWHYYGPEDIRPSNYVIDAEALGTVTVLDINNDNLLDIITFDKQDGVSVWYMSAGGGVGLQDVDLALSSLMPSYPEVDRAVNITWSVFNLSDASASDVTLTVMLDSNIVLPQIPSGCALVGTMLTCQLGEIAAGKSKDVSFSINPERDGNLSLVGDVTSLEYDVNNVNNHRDASFDFASAEKSDGGSLPLWAVLLIFMFASIRANIHRYR